MQACIKRKKETNMRDLTSQKPPEFDTPPEFKYSGAEYKGLPNTPAEYAQGYEDRLIGTPISIKVGEPHELGDGIITGGWHTDTDYGVWVMYPDGSQLMIKTS